MKAVYYEQQGDAKSVLQQGDVPSDDPAAGEVRIKLVTSGVNPSDTKMRSGWGGALMAAERVVPHNDGGGVIGAVGDGVSADRLGQRVWVYEAQQHGRASGTCAESVTLPERFAVPLPDEADFETAASLGVPAMTAHRALFADGSIEGQTILVSGGLGGVGHMAIQLAKWGGARVLTTVGTPEEFDAARKWGADDVFDYHDDGLGESIRKVTDGRGVDRVVEVAFEHNLETNLDVLKPNGTLATYASGDADSAPTFPFYRVLLTGLTFRFVFVYLMDDAAHADAARDLVVTARAVARGQPAQGRRRLCRIIVLYVLRTH